MVRMFNSSVVAAAAPSRRVKSVIGSRGNALKFMSPSQETLMGIFREVEGLEAGGNLFALDWCKSIKMVNIRDLVKGELVMVPSEVPDEGEPVDASFFATSGVSCLMVAEVHHGVTQSVCEFLVREIFHSDQEAPFQELSRLRMSFEVQKYFLPCLVVDSVLYKEFELHGWWKSSSGVNVRVTGETGLLGQIQDWSDDTLSVRKRSLGEGVESIRNVMSRVEEESEVSLLDGEDDDGVEVQRKGNKFWRCLDDRVWSTTVFKDIDKINLHSRLFRLLSAERRAHFLPDLHLDVSFWRREMLVSGQLNDDPGFSSFKFVGQCQGLPVWEQVVLFEAFLKSQFDILDWSKLSLVHFLRECDSNVVWGKVSSVNGRGRLCSAIRNLQMVTYVNFGESFRGCFSDLVLFIETYEEIGSYDDIFIRFHVEKLVFQYFERLKVRRRNLKVADQPRSSPAECALLLTSMVRKWVDEFPLLSKSPHLHFYSSEGIFKDIKLDESTRLALRENGRQSFQSGAGVRGPQQGVAGGVPAAGPRFKEKLVRAGAEEGVKGGRVRKAVCVWSLASQCGGVIDGVKVTCDHRHGTHIKHEDVKSQKLAEVLELVKIVKVPEKTKAELNRIFMANSGLFSSA